MVIQQGDVVWADLPPARGFSEPAGRRPVVVLQHDRFNNTLIQTIVTVGITSNLARAGAPGNVRLLKGEAGLPRPSVVNVTWISAVDRRHLLEISGRLTRARLAEIWRGVLTVLEPDVA